MIDVINDNELSVADPGITKGGGGRILGFCMGFVLHTYPMFFSDSGE